jgi:hypothetical protein
VAFDDLLKTRNTFTATLSLEGEGAERAESQIKEIDNRINLGLTEGSLVVSGFNHYSKAKI